MTMMSKDEWIAWAIRVGILALLGWIWHAEQRFVRLETDYGWLHGDAHAPVQK